MVINEYVQFVDDVIRVYLSFAINVKHKVVDVADYDFVYRGEIVVFGHLLIAEFLNRVLLDECRLSLKNVVL